MHLTNHSDYSLRVLIYLAVNRGRYVSTEEISRAYEISNNHLVKVVNRLGHRGFIEVKRGRHGGIALNRDPQEISVGAVIRATEPDFDLVECFHREDDHCPISSVCGVRNVLNEALDAFLQVLDKRTLADIMGSAEEMQTYCGFLRNSNGQKKEEATTSET